MYINLKIQGVPKYMVGGDRAQLRKNKLPYDPWLELNF